MFFERSIHAERSIYIHWGFWVHLVQSDKNHIYCILGNSIQLFCLFIQDSRIYFIHFFEDRCFFGYYSKRSNKFHFRFLVIDKEVPILD